MKFTANLLQKPLSRQLNSGIAHSKKAQRLFDH